MFDLDLLFQKSDLIPVIIQDVDTLQVLMLGFANREAVELTLRTKTAWFWSRSRQKLWNKGESSGHFLHVERVRTDCLWRRAEKRSTTAISATSRMMVMEGMANR